MCLIAFPTAGKAATVAAPVFSPAGGTYLGPQSVTLNTATSGASIRYTTNGSMPSSTAGTLYAGPITVSANVTINAIAYKAGSTVLSGITASTVSTAAYTIQAAAPAFSPSGGTYAAPQTVTLTTTTNGASIRYTTDGSTPSETAGTLYNAPFTVSATTTINAIAYESGMTDSAVASATYTISPPTISGVSPPTGAAGVQVAISGSGFGSAQGRGSVWLGTGPGGIVSWSDTQIVATVASNASSGYAEVLQSGVGSNTVPFYVKTATISTVTPASGLPRTQITIAGSNFGGTQGSGQVWLGTLNAVVQSWSDSQIVALVATGSLSGIAQVLQNGVMSNAVPFTVSVPQITGIGPNSGPVGTSVTITGSGFGASEGSGTVRLGNMAGLVSSWSDTQVVAAVASGAGSGTARVQQNGVQSNAVAFTVTGGIVATLVPNMLGMMVGDTHSIQALNAAGQPVTGLTWATSDATIVSLSGGDPPILTAVAAGQATVTATDSTGASASADVTVYSGPLPLGTVLWSNPGPANGVGLIVPAVPSPTGAADVFAFDGLGPGSWTTVVAIASDGTTAWTANISNANVVLPDFTGGLVALESVNVPNQNNTIVKYDGITGQVTILYTVQAPTESDTWWLTTMAVHPDGTIFALQGHSAWQQCDPNCSTFKVFYSVIGIDPSTGGTKFTIGLPELSPLDLTNTTSSGDGPWTLHGGGPWSSMIVAGDGYAYVPYSNCTETIPYSDTGLATGSNPDNDYQPLSAPFTCTAGLFRVDSNGNTSDGQIWAGSGKSNGDYVFGGPGGGTLISNADQGVVLSFGFTSDLESTSDKPVVEYYLAVTTGVSGGVISTPNPLTPVVQEEDGSFVGTMMDESGNNPMVAFDQGGNVRWSVPNDSPYIATADGGVIGTSGIMYDQNGNVTGQMASLAGQPTSIVPNWDGQIYTGGTGVNFEYNWVRFGYGFESEAGGNPSGNATAALMLGTEEGMPIWPNLNKAPACVLGADTDKVALGGDMLTEYNTSKEALLAYLKNPPTSICATFFNKLSNGPYYFSQLTSAVTNQNPFDLVLSHLSFYAAGLYTQSDLQNPSIMDRKKKYPICSGLRTTWGSWNTVVMRAQVMPPATDVYVITIAQAKGKVTPVNILHEALHNLTRKDDDDLYLWLTGNVLGNQPSIKISNELAQNKCAP